MAADLTIRVLTNKNPDFYPVLGPFLARREVVQEVGGPLWDDDDKTWFVALDGGRVAGFCATRDAGPYVAFTSDYVLPEYRDRGVYRELFAERMRSYTARPVRATCRPTVANTYAGWGFRQTSETREFVRMRREPSDG